jgi:very-short-patch-repair endonuclease
VTTAQLRAAGFGANAIARRVEGGWLVRQHQGVYQVGVFGGPFARDAAALLACGPLAALSHFTSGAHWELGKRNPRAPIDVSVPDGFPRRRPGVRCHLAWARVVDRHGLRITTPARTLLDLASMLSFRRLDRMVEEAEVRKLVTRAELLVMVERGAGRPGVKALREIVGSPDEPAFTRSEAEKRLLELVRAAELPMPRTNVRVAGLEVDAVWPQQRLVVEVDGFQYHGIRQAFERDRRRDGKLLVAGYRVLRITWRRLTREPQPVIALLAAALRVH